MTRAYSVAQASVIAPFEYASLPINVLWGLLMWHELPTVMTIAGACITLLSGLYILLHAQTSVPRLKLPATSNAASDLTRFK